MDKAFWAKKIIITGRKVNEKKDKKNRKMVKYIIVLFLEEEKKNVANKI